MGFLEKVFSVFEYIDDKIGPSKKDYKPACYEAKDMLIECILQSKCFKETENFKYCLQEGIDKECKAIRYDTFLCKRSQVFWEKSFNRDDPR